MDMSKDVAKGAMGAAKEMSKGAVGAAKGVVGRAKEMVGLVQEGEQQQVPEPEQSLLEELNQSCALTYKQRLYGFVSCLLLGIFCSLLSLLVFFHPIKFAITYSAGNLLSLSSTGFLIGFGRQLSLMCDPVRGLAAGIFIAAIFCTLIAALYVHDALLTMVCIIVQSSALTCTGFLIGFGRQLSLMCDPVRGLAAGIFIAAIFCTLIAALYVHDALLTMVCIIVQSSALTWYSLSFIPFAQAAAKRVFRSCLETEF
eukprot:TRINITY_DN5918_c1_g1_i4.p1 TRINITY_DN5918_c1_g1~~TRINITY_DN5918_c1_g1_i4.p1  ORF type:complete len:300 (-),score=88.40 TRINITY_DN5918_c1_g1_i4:374-1141(-)